MKVSVCGWLHKINHMKTYIPRGGITTWKRALIEITTVGRDIESTGFAWWAGKCTFN